jgi:5-methylcytosine-specific restriction protein A
MRWRSAPSDGIDDGMPWSRPAHPVRATTIHLLTAQRAAFHLLRSAAVTATQNPDWSVDELILALDLYVREHLLDDTDPKVIELSETLNALPLHPPETRTATFRNPNGVARKLTNLANFDPAYGGKPTKGARLDEVVYKRWASTPAELAQAAAAIRLNLSVGELPSTPEPDEDEVQADEGTLLYRRHRVRERSAKLRAAKIKKATAGGSPLRCEVCHFDFEATYGNRGAGFMECHHVRPLHEVGTTTTRVEDLALVCANCHRMIHRREPWPTPGELADLLSHNEAKH